MFANIWSWLNADDQIGNQVFVFNQDQFVTPEQPDQRVGTLGFSQRWRNEGDWEIHGAMSLTETCIANSTASILTGKTTKSGFIGEDAGKYGKQLAAMRHFRDQKRTPTVRPAGRRAPNLQRPKPLNQVQATAVTSLPIWMTQRATTPAPRLWATPAKARGLTRSPSTRAYADSH